MWPSIDHSTLSPSGRVSKQARQAAIRKAGETLFPPDYRGAAGPGPQESDKDRDLRMAAEYRHLAASGMSPRKYAKLAAALEAKRR